jgi:hypothetical protein
MHAAGACRGRQHRSCGAVTVGRASPVQERRPRVGDKHANAPHAPVAHSSVVRPARAPDTRQDVPPAPRGAARGAGAGGAAAACDCQRCRPSATGCARPQHRNVRTVVVAWQAGSACLLYRVRLHAPDGGHRPTTGGRDHPRPGNFSGGRAVSTSPSTLARLPRVSGRRPGVQTQRAKPVDAPAPRATCPPPRELGWRQRRDAAAPERRGLLCPPSADATQQRPSLTHRRTEST